MPDGCCVVAGSTPVVAFGHPLEARAATLGINPSVRESRSPSGVLLAGDARRLATTTSLGLGDGEPSEKSAAQVIDDCAKDDHVAPTTGSTRSIPSSATVLRVYFDSTACHLDLVQWATDPVWGKLPSEVRDRLLDADKGFLREQLAREHYAVVVVNGKTAMDWVAKAGIVSWSAVQTLAGPPTATIVVGDVPLPLFIGWSCNLQSQHGAERHLPALAAALRTHGSGVPSSASVDR